MRLAKLFGFDLVAATPPPHDAPDRPPAGPPYHPWMAVGDAYLRRQASYLRHTAHLVFDEAFGAVLAASTPLSG